MRHISAEEHQDLQRTFQGELGSKPQSYVLEDRYREAPQAASGKSAPARNHEFARVGERLDRTTFGQTTNELSSTLLSKVYGLLAFSMLFTAVGVFAGLQLDPVWSLMIFFAQLGLIFAINANREQPCWNLVLLYAFCFATGLLLGPLVAAFVVSGHQTVLLQALAATAVITGGMVVIGLRMEANL